MLQNLIHPITSEKNVSTSKSEAFPSEALFDRAGAGSTALDFRHRCQEPSANRHQITGKHGTLFLVPVPVPEALRIHIECYQEFTVSRFDTYKDKML